MNLKSMTVVGLAIVAPVLVVMAIIIVPAELLFYVNTGNWHSSMRAANAAPADTNDFRLYRNAFRIQKKPGQARILVVGGSTTYGFGVNARDAWPNRLRTRLDERFPGKVEVVDVSYLGGHLESFMSDYLHANRRYIPRERWLEGERPDPGTVAGWGWRDLDPDIVIIAPLVNDTAPDFTFIRSHSGRRWWEHRVGKALDAAVVGDLAISHYLKVALRKLPRREGDFLADRAIRGIAESYKGNLERFIALWGGKPRIFVIGLPWLFNEDDAVESVDLAVKAWGATDRAELVDELSYLPHLETMERRVRNSMEKDLAGRSVVVAEVGQGVKARPFRQRLPLYLDGVHVTADGHDLFAGEIHELLASAGLASAWAQRN